MDTGCLVQALVPFRRAIGRSISLGSSHSSMDLLGSVDGVTFLLGIGTISRT